MSDTLQIQEAVRSLVRLFKETLQVEVEPCVPEDVVELADSPSALLVLMDFQFDESRDTRDIERVIDKAHGRFTAYMPPRYGDLLFRVELYARQHLSKENGTPGVFALHERAMRTFIDNPTLAWRVGTPAEEVIKPLVCIPQAAGRFTSKPNFSNIRTMELSGAVQQIKIEGKEIYSGPLLREVAFSLRVSGPSWAAGTVAEVEEE